MLFDHAVCRPGVALRLLGNLGSVAICRTKSLLLTSCSGWFLKRMSTFSEMSSQVFPRTGGIAAPVTFMPMSSADSTQQSKCENQNRP